MSSLHLNYNQEVRDLTNNDPDKDPVMLIEEEAGQQAQYPGWFTLLEFLAENDPDYVDCVDEVIGEEGWESLSDVLSHALYHLYYRKMIEALEEQCMERDEFIARAQSFLGGLDTIGLAVLLNGITAMKDYHTEPDIHEYYKEE
tara:strand:- start:2413 stop:2844 length:432 start_codon:yes stop_codon:yes gene_type:complete